MKNQISSDARQCGCEDVYFFTRNENAEAISMLYYALELQGGEEEEETLTSSRQKNKRKKEQTRMNDPIFFFFRYG
jgi:hypothetical protein